MKSNINELKSHYIISKGLLLLLLLLVKSIVFLKCHERPIADNTINCFHVRYDCVVPCQSKIVALPLFPTGQLSNQ